MPWLLKVIPVVAQALGIVYLVQVRRAKVRTYVVIGLVLVGLGLAMLVAADYWDIEGLLPIGVEFIFGGAASWVVGATLFPPSPRR